jgi:hypothetical protein
MDTDMDVLARKMALASGEMRDSSAECVVYKDRNKTEPAQGVQTLNGSKQKPFSGIFVDFRGLTLNRAPLIRPRVPSNGPEFEPGERRMRLSLPDEQ